MEEEGGGGGNTGGGENSLRKKFVWGMEELHGLKVETRSKGETVELGSIILQNRGR